MYPLIIIYVKCFYSVTFCVVFNIYALQYVLMCIFMQGLSCKAGPPMWVDLNETTLLKEILNK